MPRRVVGVARQLVALRDPDAGAVLARKVARGVVGVSRTVAKPVRGGLDAPQLVKLADTLLISVPLHPIH